MPNLHVLADRILRAMLGTPRRRLVTIALFIRLLPAALIFGTDDVAGWETWARLLASGHSPYGTVYPIAWPPLWIPFPWLALVASDTLHLPFHLIVKLFPIAADLGVTLLLYSAAEACGQKPWATALAYALNPISIYTTAVHGQFDPLPTLCATAAAVYAGREAESGSAWRPGIWVGIGAAFKTWPLFVLPAVIAPLRPLRRQAFVVGVSAAIFAFVLFAPAPFVGLSSVVEVLRYRGAGGWWGLTSLPVLGVLPMSPAIAGAIFYAVMAGAAVLVLVARPRAIDGALLMLLTFYVFTPGFGLQYLIWVVPIALLADRGHALVYSALGGALVTLEVLMRPYAGHVGDMVRILPHAGYARAYGSGTDHRYTVAIRLLLWTFFWYWWAATVWRSDASASDGHRPCDPHVAVTSVAPARRAHDARGTREAVDASETERPVDTLALAAKVKNKLEEKWDWALDDATLCASYAGRRLERNPARGRIA